MFFIVINMFNIILLLLSTKPVWLQNVRNMRNNTPWRQKVPGSKNKTVYNWSGCSVDCAPQYKSVDGTKGILTMLMIFRTLTVRCLPPGGINVLCLSFHFGFCCERCNLPEGKARGSPKWKGSINCGSWMLITFRQSGEWNQNAIWTVMVPQTVGH